VLGSIPIRSTIKRFNMVVKAIFKGTDGSEGYRYNMEYTLLIIHKKGEEIRIERMERTGVVLYDSMKAFLSNWDCIRVMG